MYLPAMSQGSFVLLIGEASAAHSWVTILEVEAVVRCAADALARQTRHFCAVRFPVPDIGDCVVRGTAPWPPASDDLTHPPSRYRPDLQGGASNGRSAAERGESCLTRR